MKKIMFNDRYGLTQAVLEGRKTQTRRWLTSAPDRYKLGEIVAIAQSYRDIYNAEKTYENQYGFSYQVMHAHNVQTWEDLPGFSNKMFVKADLMPHRIWITDVRKENLQDITMADCISEGIIKTESGLYSLPSGTMLSAPTPEKMFEYLIDFLYGKGVWSRNPLVTVYEFQLA